MNKQTLIGVFIGLLIGAGATYMWCPRNCTPGQEAEPIVFGARSPGENITSSAIPLDTAIRYLNYYRTGQQRLLGSNGQPLRGWFIDTELLSNLLDSVTHESQKYGPIGAYAYLGRRNAREHTLIWGAAIEVGTDTIFIQDNLWDYIDPCPNRCPTKGGL